MGSKEMVKLILKITKSKFRNSLIYGFIDDLTKKVLYRLKIKKIVNLNIAGFKFKIKINTERGIIDRDILIKKEYSTHISKYVCNNLKKADIFIDVGANIGYFSILGSKIVGVNGRVYSYEPLKYTFNLLQENIKLNNLKNIFSLNYALGNENKTEKIYFNKNELGHSSFLNNVSNNYENIKIRKFDENFEYKNKNIKMIKIDVEGFEFEVLKGMNKSIKKCKPLILLEFSPIFYEKIFKDSNYSLELLEFLKKYNYELYEINKKAELKKILDLKNFLKKCKQSDLLCIPK